MGEEDEEEAEHSREEVEEGVLLTIDDDDPGGQPGLLQESQYSSSLAASCLVAGPPPCTWRISLYLLRPCIALDSLLRSSALCAAGGGDGDASRIRCSSESAFSLSWSTEDTLASSAFCDSGEMPTTCSHCDSDG